MIKFTKGDGVKMIQPGSELIERLHKDGWSSDEVPQKAVDNVDFLRAEAKALGLTVHHKTGAAKLAEIIREAKGE